MKKTVIAILILILPFFYFVGKHFWRGELMSPGKVCKKWGNIPLDIEKFKKHKTCLSVQKWPVHFLRNKKSSLEKIHLKLEKYLEIMMDFISVISFPLI